jgi:hypothetical protein
MKKLKEFDVISASKLVGSNLLHSSRKKLNPDEVPIELRHLIGLAERWGESDDILRDRLVESADREELKGLVEILEPYESQILDWLAGPEATGTSFSDAYIAFTGMTMVYDLIVVRHEREGVRKR